jgi:hypothetical protein
VNLRLTFVGSEETGCFELLDDVSPIEYAARLRVVLEQVRGGPEFPPRSRRTRCVPNPVRSIPRERSAGKDGTTSGVTCGPTDSIIATDVYEIRNVWLDADTAMQTKATA